MRYVSTRGAAAVSFAEAALAGLAPDGGLYVPEVWPRFDEQTITSWRELNYQQLAYEIMSLFMGDALPRPALKKMIAEAYGSFDDPAVAPLRPVGEGRYLLELFHGPTLAFKDIALQFLGRLFDALLPPDGPRALVLGATSGDTGSAAIAGCMACKNHDIAILYPHGRPSEIQRRQMTTVAAPNVRALAIEGTFDDCQRLVKELFADVELRQKRRLLAVNSINWARVLAQIVYYFYAALKLDAPERSVSFVVPTGNFGNIYAGYAAHRMGLPIAKLAAAANRNDAVHRFFSTGRIDSRVVEATLSPSMDILVPSNLERLLFELLGRQAGKMQAVLQNYRATGTLAITPIQLGEARQIFTSASTSDEETLATMRRMHEKTGITIDPHTAVGFTASDKLAGELPEPVICLATAHAAKFPETVRLALGQEHEKHSKIKEIMERSERFAVVPANLVEVRRLLVSQV